MNKRIFAALLQIKYFKQDVVRSLGKNRFRIVYYWLSRPFVGIILYRIERFLYLLIGRYYHIVRIPLVPIFYLMQVYSNTEIHYRANIGGGLVIHHASLGIVVSGHATVGMNLTMTGGNVIGVNNKIKKNSNFVIGDNCSMGANSTIIGPLILGNRITVGSSACVVKDCEKDCSVLIGVPAKIK